MCCELLANRPINLFHSTATLGSSPFSSGRVWEYLGWPGIPGWPGCPCPLETFLLVLKASTVVGFTSSGASRAWFTQVHNPDTTPPVERKGKGWGWVLSRQISEVTFLPPSFQADGSSNLSHSYPKGPFSLDLAPSWGGIFLAQEHILQLHHHHGVSGIFVVL